MPDLIEVQGLQEVLAKLTELEETAKYVQPALQAIGDDIINAAGQYPPASEANFPRPGGWYERGYGPRWFGGRGGSRTSEVLGKQWRQQVREADLSVLIENLASYAPLVHGVRQAAIHAQRGWKQLTVTAQELLPKIVARLEEKVNQIINK